ncbi:MAG: phosphoribosylglycinamide formyltransferase [Chloroflexi bacterium]|nr:phosphoribosylglycinamide formyltransferase [Chloroflexota bacterium]
MSALRLGVLVSGRGTNLQAILDAEARGELSATVAIVISNHPGVLALERAQRAGVPTAVVVRADYPTRRAHDAAIVDCLRRHDVRLVACAGYDRIVTAPLLEAFRHRIINVHPALLPAFAGSLHAQADALAHGVKVSGCTVHFVTEQVDGGPIIVQRVVPVQEDDDAERLAARILAEEHRALPEAIRLFGEGRLRVEGRRVCIGEG